MFSKKLHADVKKSTQKIQDLKKDSATRLKHLKIVLEHVDADEAKAFFETNFSHIYYILYDSFVTAETNLRQRELSFHLAQQSAVFQWFPDYFVTRAFPFIASWDSIKYVPHAMDSKIQPQLKLRKQLSVAQV